MSIFTTWFLRCSGLAGILGALLFIGGDLLYNHLPGSTASPTEKMGKMPAGRLLAAGTLGMVGCWFYVFASMHPYLALRPAGEIFAFIFLLAFGAVMICYGISHTAYFSIAAGAKAALQAGSAAEPGGRLGSTFFQRLLTITYFPVAVSSIMMIYAIVTGKSLYPGWMLFFQPILIYILKTPVVRLLQGRLGEMVNDSYDNIVMLVFFTLSTIILWNGTLV